ncbi:MAG: hypothetical protein KF881_01525 [Acidobacteria bacterium]|nr:hypothetical protein [Acidobacteriota bacterium]
MPDSNHCCNLGTPQPPYFINITTEKEMLSDNVNGDLPWLICVHLNWDGRPLSSDYGFEIASIIRTKLKSTAPIIFYSPIAVEYFEKKSQKDLKYKLLFGRGSAFIQSPFTKAALDKVIKATPPLTPAALHDVVTMLCDLKGMVLDKLNHDLKPGKDPVPPLDEIEPFLNSIQRSEIMLDEHRANLQIAFESNYTSRFLNAKKDLLDRCSARLTAAGVDLEAAEERRFKILLVEDNEDDIQNAFSHLQGHFDVLVERDAARAIKLLKEDKSNEILAVVCDWRLYKEGSKYWQKYQGYEVLEEASKTGRALFALTSQADFVIHQIRNDLGFRFQLIKKDDFRTDAQKNLLVDWIRNACQNSILAEADIPTTEAKTWRGDLRDLFLRYRQSLEWEDLITIVYAQADEIVEYFENSDEATESIPKKFGLSFGKSNDRKRLFSVLVMRLIWFGLWYKYGFDHESAEFDLAGEDGGAPDGFDLVWEFIVGPEAKGQKGGDLLKVALSEEDLGSGRMFPHERAWLLSRGLQINVVANPSELLPEAIEPDQEQYEEEEEKPIEFTEEMRAELKDLRNKLTTLAKETSMDEARKSGKISDVDVSRLRTLSDIENSWRRNNPG